MSFFYKIRQNIKCQLSDQVVTRATHKCITRFKLQQTWEMGKSSLMSHLFLDPETLDRKKKGNFKPAIFTASIVDVY